MDRADFIHLVRMSEHASNTNSQAYRRSVAGFAALGYVWVLGCLGLAIGLLTWTVGAMGHGRFKGVYIGLLITALGLLWTSLRALWCRLDAPEGIALHRAEVPALFEALDRIRKKTKGPAIDHVLLDASFNASITQLPRFGLFGGATNYLCIGLPLLMALDRPRFLAVLAHEYGHLRGGHGQFAAWIYRTRLSWMKLEHSMRHDAGPVAVATQAFLRWYFPRFLAKTFAMARQDEYEADHIAGKLLGREVAGAALTEMAIKGSWMRTEFWPLHWSAAATQALPVGPYTHMRTLLALPPEENFCRDALQHALKQISDVDDTHPVLKDRLESLKVPPNLPTWSNRSAMDLLGSNNAQWLAHFDKEWCKDNATDWKLHHAYLNRVQVRVATLNAGLHRNTADEMAELGNLQKRLDAGAAVRSCYEQALKLSPAHPAGLRGLVQCLPASEHDLRMACLGTLFDNSAAHRWWACQTAVRALEQRVAQGIADDQALKLWRERRKKADDAEERAWEELTETSFFESITRHDLNDFEAGELQSDLARSKAVTRAWAVRKNLREFAYRRCYIVFVELPKMDDEDRYHLCRTLERTLDLPGPALVLWAGHSPTLEEIRQNAFEPVFIRARG